MFLLFPAHLAFAGVAPRSPLLCVFPPTTLAEAPYAEDSKHYKTTHFNQLKKVVDLLSTTFFEFLTIIATPLKLLSQVLLEKTPTTAGEAWKTNNGTIMNKKRSLRYISTTSFYIWILITFSPS